MIEISRKHIPIFLFENALLNTKEWNILFDTANQMKDDIAITMKDRRWKLKIYKKCFLASDVVNWLDKNFDVGAIKSREQLNLSNDVVNFSRSECLVAMANEMVRAGYIHHVKHEHWFGENIQHALFFRFHRKFLKLDTKIWKHCTTNQKREFILSLMKDSMKLQMHSFRLDQSTKDLNWETNELNLLRYQISESNLMIERLTRTVTSSTKTLDECNLKINMLQNTVTALVTGFFFFSVAGIIITISMEKFNGLLDFLKLIIPAFIIYLVVLSKSSLKEKTGVNNLGPFALLKIIWNGDFHKSMNLVGMDEDSISTIDSHLGPISLSKPSSYFTGGFNITLRKASSKYLHSDTIKMRHPSSLLPVNKWPHRPCLVCVNTPVCPDLRVPKYGVGACPIGIPFEMESDLFEGVILIRIKGLQSDDVASDKKYFEGRRRIYQTIVQGRFKEELLVSDVLTGHEFVRPIKNIPPAFVLNAATSMMRRIARGAEIDLTSSQPKFLAPLAGTSQIVSADMPGNQPNISSNDIEEDCSLFGGAFEKRNINSTKRKQIFASPELASKYKFDTESIYTFDFYQNLLDASTYNLSIGFTNLAMKKRLDGQPIQSMAKTRDGRYLWSFQIWHEKLLPKI